MQKVRSIQKRWIALSSLALVAGITIGLQAGGNQVVIDPGWRYHDGHWNYWDSDDRAWYYTDGRSWYTYGDNAWRPYGFDRNFGRRSFYREGYVVPKLGRDIVIPKHPVYVP